MTDDELVRGFEACTLDPFPHAAHVRAAWCYLRGFPLLVAVARFKRALQRFAASKGKPDRYHETITIALLLLVMERMARSPALSWEEFAAHNPDLLEWPCPTLRSLYGKTLDTPAAREVFVLPAVDDLA